MSAQRILLDVLNRGVQVGVDGGDLSVRAIDGALTPELRDKVKALKTEIVEFIGAERRLARVSFAQRRMWFIDQLTPGSALYTATAATYRLHGTIDTAALELAVNGVVRRHEALRTTFPFVNGEPVQSIQAFIELKLPVIDLGGCRSDEREFQAIAKASELVNEPFDLASGPLFRPALIRIDSDDHILVLPMHHIINDGWSVGLLYSELRDLYDAHASGRTPDLPALKTQYADISELQHRLVESEDGAKQLSYWKDRLGGAIPVLNLTGDRSRSTSPEFNGARERIVMDSDLAASLKKLGRAEGATLFMVGLAAYYVLLHRYTRNEDIVVGSPIAGRTLEHTQDLLGLFVNTVALRAPVRADDSLRDVIRSARDTALGAFANQDVPFDKVVAEVQPDRDLTHSPLFRVMFVLQNAPVPESNLGDARLIPMELDTGTAKFDLSLELMESEDGVRATLEYNREMFGDDHARCLLRHYETLLKSLAENPGQTVAEVDIIPAAEREKLVVEFNNTGVAFADSRPVHHRLTDWAARQPEAPAVLWENGSLTYGELERTANALAQAVQAAGVSRNDVVAVCAPRSPEMIVAQLAVLKAGAAFLSLDPEHPYERLAHMVRDAGARVLLLMKEHAAQFPNIETITIDLESECNATPIECDNKPTDLAYVIYTSGSTGQPKGVAIEHAGLANLAAWHQRAFDVHETDRGSQLASPAFDASVWEIWPYLSAGAAVTLCPEDVRAEPAAFRDWLLAERVTVSFAPTDLIESLFTLEWPAETTLHHLLTGGAWLAQRPPDGLPFKVVNNYGPTENSVVTTSGIVTPGEETSRMPSIGRAIANHHVYILDDAMRVAPLGVPGELYIGGAGLAREYLNDAARTKRHFVFGPADSPSPQRLYKTGDRGRFLPDGRIQFLGRRDHQVNVRGHRIELAEIGAAALTHEGIAEAVAMSLADEAVSGEQRREYGLRLFVTPNAEGASADTDDAAQSHVRQWQTLYDGTYADSPINMDPALNVIGWNSSYTGAPIPVDEMREWRDCTVDRLRAFKPRRVLEIGSGTGMLLAELAPDCESYVAADFSAESLEYVRANLVDPRGLHHVELMQVAAHELDRLNPRTFDLVILNSVVQYFPSVEYLKDVMESAVRLASPKGTVFVGDVRNHALLNQFHTAVQMQTASPETPAAAVVNRVNCGAASEEELLADPVLFHRIAKNNPAIAGVQTLIKRGRSDNELIHFRYDAVLLIGERAAPIECTTVDCSTAGSWSNEVHNALAKADTGAIRITGIPNGRVAHARNTSAALPGAAAVGQTWGSVLKQTAPDNGADPETVIDRFSDLPFDVSLHCNLDQPDRFDVLFVKKELQGRFCAEPMESATDPVAETNVPLDAGHLRGLAAGLRDHLQRALPAYMIPNRIVPLAAFPRTASGKVDRQALCALDAAVPATGQFVAPRTELEEAIVDMWRILLGVDRVGVDDNFFELGGHSLLATQLVAQISEAYGVELPLRELFVRPTPAGIAVAVEEALMREIEDLTEDEAARLVAS